MADKNYTLTFEMSDGTTQSVEFAVPVPGALDIPAYWQSALDTGVKEINSAMLEAGYNKSAFLFYTDAHWNYNCKMSPSLLKYLYQHTGMNKTFFGGDIVLNESVGEDAMAYLWEWREQLKGLPNHHSVVGNHDDGNTTNNLFSEQYVYGYLLSAEETPDIVRGENGLYYYIDSPGEKTRYLFLDTAFQMVLYDAKQVQFIVDALNAAPDGWHIVAVAHIWYNTANDETVGTMSYGGAMLLNLFDAYNSRKSGTLYVANSSTDGTSTAVAYDFTSGGGKVEFCVGGHTHWDYDGASSNGIPVILCETDSTLVRSGLDHAIGTANEASVSGIVADYDAGKITVVRVGRGESRAVMFAMPYKNQLRSATDADGNVYEGTDASGNTVYGYTENKRINSSSVETTATGWDLTGYIPVTLGDVVRFKNMEYLDISEDGGATARTQFYFYDETFTRVTSSALHSLTSLPSSAWEPVYGENGDVVQMTIPTSSGDGSAIKYMRICCGDLNENSIITLNEEIV